MDHRVKAVVLYPNNDLADYSANNVSGGENPRLNGEVGLSAFCVEGAVVLVAVKDACRAASRWPSAILDRPCARRHGRRAGRGDGMAVLIEQQDDCFGWSRLGVAGAVRR
jgi:hypothetical protein